MIALGHINIRTDRLEDTVRFYCDLLGFRRGEAATRPGSANHAWLFDSAGSPSIHVQAPALPAGGDQSPRSGVHHVAFNCSGIDAWTERLKAAGVDFTRSDFPEAGMAQLNLTDPNGVRLELSFGHEGQRMAPLDKR